MALTLEQMYEMQKQLDSRIIREKGLEGRDLLPNTVLALQVEIGELANEWRGFKHWSNDREPRTRVKDCLGCSGCKSSEGCEICGGANPLLEEYVDCLHFFLSIARQLSLDAEDLYMPDDELEGDTSILFTELLHNVGMINGHRFFNHLIEDTERWQKEYFQTALYLFYLLGEQRLGVTFDQIAAAYVAKNKVNHQRQESGY
ncbi:dUTP diphosphatase [Neobacillus sp.]|uniref:dUTP diphosphatase n=1 Tax=Neobacillus sp. TaxID=2675273 RepID=UPI0035B55FD4